MKETKSNTFLIIMIIELNMLALSMKNGSEVMQSTVKLS